MPIAVFDLQQAMMLAGIGILTFMMLRKTRRYQQQVKREAKRSEREKKAISQVSIDLDQQQPLLDAPSSVLRWQVEMHETARELQGKLDTKMRALQVLIAQAETATSHLQSAIEQAKLDNHVEPHRVETADEVPTEWADSRVELPGRERFGEIYGLADEGNNAADISGQIGIPVGDIELILSLRSSGA